MAKFDAMKMVALHAPHTQLALGKYKGQTVREVLKHDPAYIEWCTNNVRFFVLTDEAHDQMIDALAAHDTDRLLEPEEELEFHDHDGYDDHGSD